MTILGISRGAIYSPNLASSDAAIFQAVAQQLQERGHHVDCIAEDAMLSYDHSHCHRIFTMARDTTTIRTLQAEAADRLPTTLNSLSGIITCTSKGTVASLMLLHDIPQPDFIYGYGQTITKSSKPRDQFRFPLWVKNSVSSAILAGDTVYCTNEAELHAALQDFQRRDIDEWLVQEHVKGDLIKFYGVSGTDFFYWFYPSKCGHRSKFGLEVINGEAQGIAFDAEDLKAEADKAADMLNVPVYGGDCVVSEDGSIRIIDFNDWPSFAPCRDEAAFYIATKMVCTP